MYISYIIYVKNKQCATTNRGIFEICCEKNPNAFSFYTYQRRVGNTITNFKIMKKLKIKKSCIKP